MLILPFCNYIFIRSNIRNVLYYKGNKQNKNKNKHRIDQKIYKAQTDVSYLANARKLLGLTDHIYPQFATHNAHTIAAVADLAGDEAVGTGHLSEAIGYRRLDRAVAAH